MRRARNLNSSLDLPVKLPLLDCYANQSSGWIIPSTTRAGSRNPGKKLKGLKRNWIESSVENQWAKIRLDEGRGCVGRRPEEGFRKR